MSQVVDKLNGIQTAWLYHMPPDFSFSNVKQAIRNDIAYYHIIIPVKEFYSAIPLRSVMPFSPALSTYTFPAMLNHLF
jgi:hypothetical protein